ncbi:restriction endonuclease subunit S [Clostridium perfringens]|uniref:restriction endonuclease subunit S n=1 Tax=Clostridium perfringens TaxID=1502 RepID=UPI002468D356|nr:restriction endonuclease subunit S [Clostridium perfringens]MDH5087369.1 putative type-1 restriction enzyme specificity protein MPN089 [Clostridium perfringens]MDK0772630.1 restriction endonuclease subunit S [Clostridium perfringens]MDK0777828.1 restriction endonuclease subunit S [Clostridium perfringens]MDM0449565.1 restriction endonuclease subunit S [Clostridium perfringens]
MKSKEKEYNDKETLFGKVPYDWNVSNIGEIADLRQGLQISKKLRVDSNTLGAIPLLKITDMPQKCFSEYVKDVPEQYIADENDIIYTRTGQVGLVYTNLNGCVHNNCFKVIVDYNYFDKQYIYYYLSSKNVEKYSNNVAGGSVQKDLTHGAFKTCKIAYPSLKEQKVISKILSDLDEKIEVNNKINKNLEEMAQAIFKQWFVDFEFPNEEGKPYKSSGGEMVKSELGMIPKGWEKCTLDKVANVSAGGDKPKKFSKIACDEYTVPIYSNGIDREGLYGYTDKAKILEESVTVSARGTIGYVCLRHQPYVPIVRLISVTPNTKLVSAKYLYFLLKRTNIIGTGTTQQQLTVPDFKKTKMYVPQYEYMKKFTIIVNSWFERINNNNIENERLEKLRDTLLPKLMSGEIRVPLENNEN